MGKLRRSSLVSYIVGSVVVLIFFLTILINEGRPENWFPVYLIILVYLIWIGPRSKIYIFIGLMTTFLIVFSFLITLPEEPLDIHGYYLKLMIIFTLWLAIYFIHRHRRNSINETKEKNRLNAIFENATEGILVINQNGEIQMVNRYAENLFGFSRMEAIGKKVEMLIPERFAQIHNDHRIEYSKDPHNRPMGSGKELFALHKDGHEFPVEISLGYFRNDAGIMVVAFVMDISLRKKVEGDLQQLNLKLESIVMERTADLKKAMTELEKRNQDLIKIERELSDALEKERDLGELKSRFVTTASHEFRTPLSTILSSVFLLENFSNERLLDIKENHFDRIKRSANTMTSILDDFLSLSKLEEGRVNINYTSVDVKSWCKEIVDGFEAIKKAGQTISLQYSGNEMPRMIDMHSLRIILNNLLSNAIKFSGPNTSIELAVIHETEQMLIKVSDNGIGIPEEEQKHLFNKFYRAKNAMNIAGTGLGLSIVKKYVELMDGKITFQSQLNKGTSFMVVIPAKYNEQANLEMGNDERG